jgi:N-methylhydantoinase A
VAPAEVAAAYTAMEAEARRMLARAGVPEARWAVTRAADCRYPRQAYELTVPVAGGEITAATLAVLARDFHARHRATYGHASPDEPVQCVNLRVAAVGRLAPLALDRAPVAPAPAAAPSSRPAYFEETGLAPCPVLAREGLAPGYTQAGPLIVESPDTTVVVPPAWRLTVEAGGLLALETSHA